MSKPLRIGHENAFYHVINCCGRTTYLHSQYSSRKYYEASDLTPVSTLATAKEEEQKEFEVSPSGYGIHWPLIDEDISIDGLLGVAHKPSANKKSAQSGSRTPAPTPPGMRVRTWQFVKHSET